MATTYQTKTYTNPMSTQWDPPIASLQDSSYDQPHLYEPNHHNYSSANGYKSDTKYSTPHENDSAYYSQRGTTLEKKPSMVSVLDPDIVDRDAWIHRDKLAQIESMEMARAGITIRQPSRNRDNGSQSRSQSRSASRTGAKHVPAHEVPRNRKQSPHHEDSQLDEEDETMEYDPAMLIPVASVDRSQLPHNKQSASANSRSATSRIPVAKSSPAPLPRPVVERDAPLPRSRAGSNPWNASPADRTSMDRRSRSQSLGSQAMLEDAVASSDSSPERGRPASSQRDTPVGAARGQLSNSTRNRTAAKQPMSSVNSRKSATNRAIGSAQSRGVSAPKTSPGARPASSPTTRPKTGTKRPEGDAPWIATMYKPDPRLPPDQQLLPTLAKRMLQEQGASTISDRDFNLLDDAELAKMGAFPLPSPVVEQGPVEDGPRSPEVRGPEAQASWPLRTGSRPSLRTGTSTGVYKTTPSVPRPGSSGSGPRGALASRKSSVRRMPDLDEKNEPQRAEKEKGCCCIVM